MSFGEANSSLGERLAAAVRSLFEDTRRLNVVAGHHGQEIEALKQRLSKLEREDRSAKTPKGIAKAKLDRAEQELQEVSHKLS